MKLINCIISTLFVFFPFEALKCRRHGNNENNINDCHNSSVAENVIIFHTRTGRGTNKNVQDRRGRDFLYLRLGRKRNSNKEYVRFRRTVVNLVPNPQRQSRMLFNLNCSRR